MTTKLSKEQIRILTLLRDKPNQDGLGVFSRNTIAALKRKGYIANNPDYHPYDFSRAAQEWLITAKGANALDELSPAKKLSMTASKAIYELSKFMDSDDPKIVDDAKQYMIGLAKCLDYQLDGRGIAVVKVFEK